MLTVKELSHLEQNVVWCWTLHPSECNQLYLESFELWC